MSKKKDQERKSGRRRSGAGGGLRRPVDSYGDQSVRVIYVAGEGAKTEPDYFKKLSETYGKRKKFQIKVCTASDDKGLRPEAVVEQVLKGAEAKGDPDCEKWAFFDRDTTNNRDAAIPAAMRMAAEKGVQVGLSHPSFELWLLLHFQPFTSQENGDSEQVISKLRSHPKAKGFKDYDKDSGERGKGLEGERWESLAGKEKDAIRNARNLVAACPYGGCSPKKADEYLKAREEAGASGALVPESYEQWRTWTGHAADCDALKRDPSTDVWRLISSLGIGAEDSA
ncbi:RloB family protein [Streptomyces albireticuli]|uniref:RloB family protein n=1 Tax=Streptomyces albireticuli TaxID=1940 RepID=UPI0036A82EB3